MGYLPTNPALAVDYLATHEAKAQKETFTPEEISALLKPRPRTIGGDHPACGVCRIEARGCDASRWGNVDLQAQAITFTPSKTARLGKKLALPMHPEIEAFLLKHPAGASDDAPLFPSFAHLPGAAASIAFRRIMERAGVAAGIARQAAQGSVGRNVSARSFHSLRHSFVTALSHANVAVELRKQLAGHSSEAQSLHYTHPEFAALRAAIEKLPRVSRRRRTKKSVRRSLQQAVRISMPHMEC
jgi:integrase